MGLVRLRLSHTFSNRLSTGHLLDVAPVSERHQICLDWSAVQDATATRVSRQRTASAHSSWQLWEQFCTSLNLSPYQLGRDPIPLLQLFAQRYRSGSIAPSRLGVRTRTVEDALRAVGQAYAGMGAADPRLNAHGDVDFRLTTLFQSWKKDDPPPSRVKPLPLPVVARVWAQAQLEPATAAAQAAADCLVLGFYFLLRPGEYLGTPRHPTGGPLFRLRDVQLWIGTRALDTLTCSPTELLAATFVCLTFREQKNGVRNETIGHGRSGHPHLCPVHCVAARVVALRQSAATADTPLNAFRPSATSPFRYVAAADLTTRIRAALLLHPDPAYTLADVTVRSTRAGGAMALLCAGIDSDRIRLVGRWRSDEMYRYLHVQAQPVMTGLSAAMLRGGAFRLTPS
ncbi:hypothetical protein MHU86_927 [Fragilaria crotonensis]|nr:hypothetical protein MHU86_927 [Fragilaria crotonensis]